MKHDLSIIFDLSYCFHPYHLNKSGQAGVFGVRPHAKNTLTANC
jgi:hypothetical protein